MTQDLISRQQQVMAGGEPAETQLAAPKTLFRIAGQVLPFLGTKCQFQSDLLFIELSGSRYIGNRDVWNYWCILQH